MTQGSPLVGIDSTELSDGFELQLQGISTENGNGRSTQCWSPQSVWCALELGYSQRPQEGNQGLVHENLPRQRLRQQGRAKPKEISGTY